MVISADSCSQSSALFQRVTLLEVRSTVRIVIVDGCVVLVSFRVDAEGFSTEF